MADRVLLTGGAGFIGSYDYLALVEAGYGVMILDNFDQALHGVVSPAWHTRHGSLDRPPCDAIVCCADVSRVRNLLGFAARLGLCEMCAVNWAFLVSSSGKKG